MSEIYTKGKITNEDIKSLLIKKDKIVNEWRDISAKIEELERKLDSLAHRIQKIKDKVVPMIEEELKDLYPSEFHEATKVEVVDGEIVYELVDRIELFKESYIEAKNNKDKTEVKE